MFLGRITHHAADSNLSLLYCGLSTEHGHVIFHVVSRLTTRPWNFTTLWLEFADDVLAWIPWKACIYPRTALDYLTILSKVLPFIEL